MVSQNTAHFFTVKPMPVYLKYTCEAITIEICLIILSYFYIKYDYENAHGSEFENFVDQMSHS
jgi:hypothetical protein